MSCLEVAFFQGGREGFIGPWQLEEQWDRVDDLDIDSFSVVRVVVKLGGMLPGREFCEQIGVDCIYAGRAVDRRHGHKGGSRFDPHSYADACHISGLVKLAKQGVFEWQVRHFDNNVVECQGEKKNSNCTCWL